MARLFTVTRSRGSAWNTSLPMEQQEEWQAHAAFMNALWAEGFVLLDGPLKGTPDTLLIVRADDVATIEARLSGDPWARNGLLRLIQVAPRTLRLGSLD